MRHYTLVAAMVAAWLPLSPAMARPMNGYTVHSTAMLSGPDFNYPVVQRLRGNVGIRVHGCLRDWSWCDVSGRASRGWVAGNDIVVNYQGRRQSIQPTMGIGILSFVFGSYWDSHYRSRPFYNQRSRFDQQYSNDHRPQWGPHPRAPGMAPPRGLPDRGPQRGMTQQRPNVPPRQVVPRETSRSPQQHQPGTSPRGAGQHQNRPVQQPNMGQRQGNAPRTAPGIAPQQRQSGQVRPSPQVRPTAPDPGNRSNGQPAGQQQGGRPVNPQNRPHQNQQTPN